MGVILCGQGFIWILGGSIGDSGSVSTGGSISSRSLISTGGLITTGGLPDSGLSRNWRVNQRQKLYSKKTGSGQRNELILSPK